MKNNKQIVEIAENWLTFALDDYKIVDKLISDGETFYRTICFHSQQYVEKILKGILEHIGSIPPKTHDIQILARLVDQKGFKVPLTKEEMVFLKSVYIESRYPPDVGLLPKGEPDMHDAEYAYKIIKKIKKWITTDNDNRDNDNVDNEHKKDENS